MQASALLIIFLSYFALLLLISYFIGKNSQAGTFYNGDRKSPWFAVAFGMIGATLSGVTFVSVPGEVGNSAFHYFQFILGNFAGYILIATLLLPYYYRKNIVSIYTVLNEKMGREGYLTTSGFFILSKIVGAAFRLYLAALVIHLAIAEALKLPFGLTVLFCLLIIWLYTYKSGIKMVVWSDTIQTVILLTAVVLSIVAIKNQTGLGTSLLINKVVSTVDTSIFDFNWRSGNNFFKQFIAGIFMTIALNGFDQDIVQKNLSCRNSSQARKNMLVFSLLFVVTVFIFLSLGALLHYYAGLKSIALPIQSDQLFPTIALNHLGKWVAALFVLGISAAALSSADSATTALTTAFSIDFLKIDRFPENRQQGIRNWVHLGFSLVLFAVIMAFYYLNNQSVVVGIFKAAGYTYGPILGIFVFSFFNKRKPLLKMIFPIAFVSPLLTWGCTIITGYLIENYQFGFELIVINACFTYILLTIFSKR